MILCADDYGLNDDIGRAILRLCECGKLTAVSCMTNFEACSPDALAGLRAHGARLDIGVHLCLTEEVGWGRGNEPGARCGRQPSFKGLLWAALIHRVDRDAVAREIRSQYEMFVSKCGRRPDYLDGHLHVHQFPAVREALIDFVLSLPRDGRPYVRNTAMSLRALRCHGLPWLKAAFISAFGARMVRKLKRAGIPTNDGFAGIYNFSKHLNYAEYLPKFVECLAVPDGMLVVHPGEREDWRRSEYRALAQFNFRPGTLNRFPSPIAP